MIEHDPGANTHPRTLLSRRGVLWLTATTLAMSCAGFAERAAAKGSGSVAAGAAGGPAIAQGRTLAPRGASAPATPVAPWSSPTAARPTTPAASPPVRRVRVTAADRPAPPAAARSRSTVTLSSAAEGPVRSLPDYVRRVRGTKPFARDAVALTIDDGPHPVWTPKILRLLDKYDVRATFCIIGQQARSYPELVRAVASQGHHLANHTYGHPLDMASMSQRQMTAQVVDAQDAIVRASGFVPRQFGPPGGSWSPRMMAVLARHELIPIDWDIDPRDWSRPGTARIVHAMLAAEPGDVLLCHDGGGDRSQTYAALQTVLPRLEQRGLRFVTLPAPQHAHRT